MEFAHKLMSTRLGTAAVAGGAALLAGIFIVVYLNRYRHSIKAQGAPVTVLVAKHLIPKGTSGTAAIEEGLFTHSTVRESQLRDGAFSDPASIRGRVATTDVYAGQQLTAADFSASAKSLATTLSGAQRVIELPLPTANGLVGDVEPGDRVNIFAGLNVTTPGGGNGYPVVKLVAQNVPVADVSKSGGSGGVAASSSNTTNVSLRVNDRQAAEITYASDNGKVWLALRPPTGATHSRAGLVDAETILLGVRPVTLPSYGGRVNRQVRHAIERALAATGGGR